MQMDEQLLEMLKKGCNCQQISEHGRKKNTNTNENQDNSLQLHIYLM